MSHISDFLVIGSGIAGLSFALKAAQRGTVTIITKKHDTESNTNYAQGGIASVMAADDSFDLHIQDTLVAGAGLCHRDAVEIVVRDGPQRIQELIAWGARFTKKRREDGMEELSLGREGGHSRHRIVHTADLTGQEVERALIEAVKSHPNIRVYEHHVAIDLITEHHLRDKAQMRERGTTCWGVYALNTTTGVVEKFLAKATLLATGGAGQVYLHTTNPSIATGDGVAMAYRAGADVANLEFMQFHPTTLYHPQARSFLISEAVRGYGAVLRTQDGREFMPEYHPLGALAPRDVVARAIDRELKKSGDSCVYLDVTHKPADETRERFPNIYQRCLALGLDITKAWIPVVPAAHYMCGGIVTDLNGCTSIRGLYACGEVACTGLHGANRLASNSLLEGLVFSHHAVMHGIAFVDRHTTSIPPDIPEWNDEGTFDSEEWVLIAHDRTEIQTLMWDYVGIVRSNARLIRAQRRVRVIAEEIEEFYKKTVVTPELIELRNIATVASLIIECALTRKESRGLHYNTDYPYADDVHWKRDTTISAEWRKRSSV
ncbi:MAG: L-aspartate oxidase [Candidatus Latescibacteria bacterium]|nr:L-aspartate oxidase [Candidatus Latescibacterota bacterium]